jgi:hypothetical protein
MGHHHINGVRELSKTKGPVKYVFLMLATFTDDNGLCWSSYSTLAKKTGCALKTVQRAIKSIPKDELEIVEKGNSKGNSNKATRYRILLSYSRSDHSADRTMAKKDPNHGHTDQRTVVTETTHCGHSDHLTDRNRELTDKNTRVGTCNGILSPSASVSKVVTRDWIESYRAKKKWHPDFTHYAWGKLMSGRHYGKLLETEDDLRGAVHALYQHWQPD